MRWRWWRVSTILMVMKAFMVHLYAITLYFISDSLMNSKYHCDGDRFGEIHQKYICIYPKCLRIHVCVGWIHCIATKERENNEWKIQCTFNKIPRLFFNNGNSTLCKRQQKKTAIKKKATQERATNECCRPVEICNACTQFY